MSIVDLLDDTERQNYRHAQTMGHVCGFVLFCLYLIGMDYPITLLACIGAMAVSDEYSREMEFSVTRSPQIVYYERFAWTAKLKWFMVFKFGLMLIVFSGLFFIDTLIDMDKWSHRAIFMLVGVVLIYCLWPHLVQDFCIHHSGIFINRQFVPWRDVVGVSWESEKGSVLIMDLKRETPSFSESKQYRWEIPSEQKEKIQAFLVSQRLI